MDTKETAMAVYFLMFGCLMGLERCIHMMISAETDSFHSISDQSISKPTILHTAIIITDLIS